MGPLSWGDVVAILTAVALTLANYFGLKLEVRVMEERMKAQNDLLRQDIAPLVKWWHRMADNQASRMFLRTRVEDRNPDEVATRG